MLLRPSEKLNDDITTANRNERVVKQKTNASKETEVEKVVKSAKKEAKIGSQWL